MTRDGGIGGGSLGNGGGDDFGGVGGEGALSSFTGAAGTVSCTVAVTETVCGSSRMMVLRADSRELQVSRFVHGGQSRRLAIK